MRLLAHTRSLVGASVLLVGSSASAQSHVIPPGQERLVGEMLGRGVSMGGCRLARADIRPTQIAATYECPDAGGRVSVVLRHPSTEGAAAFRTAQFAVATQGEVPGPLLDQLRRTIGDHEAAWRWAEPQGPVEAAPAREAAREPAGDRPAVLWWLPPATSCSAMLLVVLASSARRSSRARPEGSR